MSHVYFSTLINSVVCPHFIFCGRNSAEIYGKWILREKKQFVGCSVISRKHFSADRFKQFSCSRRIAVSSSVHHFSGYHPNSTGPSNHSPPTLISFLLPCCSSTCSHAVQQKIAYLPHPWITKWTGADTFAFPSSHHSHPSSLPPFRPFTLFPSSYIPCTNHSVIFHLHPLFPRVILGALKTCPAPRIFQATQCMVFLLAVTANYGEEWKLKEFKLRCNYS